MNLSLLAFVRLTFLARLARNDDQLMTFGSGIEIDRIVRGANEVAGSIVAVTTSEKCLGSKEHRFVGICIRREKEGLHHQFTLRNVVEGIGVEVMYDLYNPTIRKIETLKLEKRLDNDLSYLVDALPEYSTFDFHMEPITHPAGNPRTRESAQGICFVLF
ncbi:putative ribosomal protein L19 [Cooperia oncophora]